MKNFVMSTILALTAVKANAQAVSYRIEPMVKLGWSDPRNSATQFVRVVLTPENDTLVYRPLRDGEKADGIFKRGVSSKGKVLYRAFRDNVPGKGNVAYILGDEFDTPNVWETPCKIETYDAVKHGAIYVWVGPQIL